LHVIERIHMIDQGKTLEVSVHVEDPGAFTTPWNAIQHYRRVVDRGPLSEIVCAENNGDRVRSKVMHSRCGLSRYGWFRSRRPP
jgi:hypothetical protein